jgi:hypothetical protein
VRRTRLLIAALAILTLSLSSTVSSAEHKWVAGTWRDSGDARTYVIATETLRFHLEDIPAGDSRALPAPVGSPVKVSLEGTRIFILDAKNVEHELHLLRAVDLRYSATGAGHFIKTMAADGAKVTLEDGSVWDLDPRAQFFTINWQPFEGISVRTAEPDRGFNYEIDNTDRDDGALARYSPP